MNLKEESWEELVKRYNLKKGKYYNGEIYYFPPDWTNGWIASMKPREDLIISSAWFTSKEKIVHKINSQSECIWILCIDSGEILINQQGKISQKLDKTTHIIINPKKPFTFTFNKSEHYCFTSVLVSNKFIIDKLKTTENKAKITIEDIKQWKSENLNTADIMLIMEQLRWAVRGGDISLLAYEAMVIHLLTSIERNYPTVLKRRENRRNYVTWENEQKIYNVKKIVDKDILNVPSIEKLSRIAEMSESKFREGFKNIYGIPIYSYIRRENMKRAMQLMSEDHLSIGEIASKCGYKNPSKFSAAFKDIHKITPSDFRKTFNL